MKKIARVAEVQHGEYRLRGLRRMWPVAFFATISLCRGGGACGFNRAGSIMQRNVSSTKTLYKIQKKKLKQNYV